MDLSTPNFRNNEKKCVFNNQGLRQLLLTPPWDLRTQRGTPDTWLVSLQFLKQHTRRVKGLWRTPCQLKKPFGSETETREFLGGMDKKVFFFTRFDDNDFLPKSGLTDIWLLATPLVLEAINTSTIFHAKCNILLTLRWHHYCIMTFDFLVSPDLCVKQLELPTYMEWIR